MRLTLTGFAALAVLSGCSDSRRPVVRAYVESHPPENMKLVGMSETYRFEAAGNGTASAQVLAKYTTLLPTVREVNALTLPRGVEIRTRLSDLRRWAIEALPAGDALRISILAAADEAAKGFPIKRVVTPAGAEVDGVVSVEMSRDGRSVMKAENTAYVPGEPDRKPELPLEGSPEMEAQFGELDIVAQSLAQKRDEFLRRREQLSAESLAGLRRLLETGRTFYGTTTGTRRLPVRLVIGRGIESGDTVVATFVVETDPQRSAQFAGRLRQEFDGRFVWVAHRTRALSGGADFPNESGIPPELQLEVNARGLSGMISEKGNARSQVSLTEGQKADVIPDRTFEIP